MGVSKPEPDTRELLTPLRTTTWTHSILRLNKPLATLCHSPPSWATKLRCSTSSLSSLTEAKPRPCWFIKARHSSMISATTSRGIV